MYILGLLSINRSSGIGRLSLDRARWRLLSRRGADGQCQGPCGTPLASTRV